MQISAVITNTANLIKRRPVLVIVGVGVVGGGAYILTRKKSGSMVAFSGYPDVPEPEYGGGEYRGGGEYQGDENRIADLIVEMRETARLQAEFSAGNLRDFGQSIAQMLARYNQQQIVSQPVQPIADTQVLNAQELDYLVTVNQGVFGRSVQEPISSVLERQLTRFTNAPDDIWAGRVQAETERVLGTQISSTIDRKYIDTPTGVSWVNQGKVGGAVLESHSSIEARQKERYNVAISEGRTSDAQKIKTETTNVGVKVNW